MNKKDRVKKAIIKRCMEREIGILAAEIDLQKVMRYRNPKYFDRPIEVLEFQLECCKEIDVWNAS